MKNQKGFSLVEGILIILLIAVVGFAAWRIIDSTTNDEDLSTQTVSQSEQQDHSASGSTKDFDSESELNQLNQDDDSSIEYSSQSGSYTLSIPEGWIVQETTAGSSSFVVQFETSNGFVTVYHYDTDKKQDDLLAQVDSTWIAIAGTDGSVEEVKMSEFCSEPGNVSFMGTEFSCDVNSTIKTRVDVRGDKQLGLLTSSEQVVFSYATKDNTEPGEDLDELKNAVLSFSAKQ